MRSLPCAHKFQAGTAVQCRHLRHKSRTARRGLSATAMRSVVLQSEQLTPDAFKPFGQVIQAHDDGKPFDEHDAQLNLTKGTPRLYIMTVPVRGLQFDRITYHEDVTQCLANMDKQDWYLVVAAPSHAVEKFPKEQDLHAFCIPPGVFVKLHEGTWHAGPLFGGQNACQFANLELADTNVVDHHTHVYTEEDVRFEIAAQAGKSLS